jgi:hypothetical protein
MAKRKKSRKGGKLTLKKVQKKIGEKFRKLSKILPRKLQPKSVGGKTLAGAAMVVGGIFAWNRFAKPHSVKLPSIAPAKTPISYLGIYGG